MIKKEWLWMDNEKNIQFNNNKLKIMSKTEIFNQIVEQFNILQGENNGTTKASQQRARKAAGEIKKLITPYKKANMAEAGKPRL
jgi:hypothetical protein